MMKAFFEYKIVVKYKEAFKDEDEINDLGKQGWELVSAFAAKATVGHVDEEEFVYYFKRTKYKS